LRILGGAALFGGALAIVAAVYFWTDLSRAALFCAAFILTRPLGATIGDLLDKPRDQGGLDISRPLASALLAGFVVAAILMIPQRPGVHPGASRP